MFVVLRAEGVYNDDANDLCVYSRQALTITLWMEYNLPSGVGRGGGFRFHSMPYHLNEDEGGLRAYKGFEFKCKYTHPVSRWEMVSEHSCRLPVSPRYMEPWEKYLSIVYIYLQWQNWSFALVLIINLINTHWLYYIWIQSFHQNAKCRWLFL